MLTYLLPGDPYQKNDVFECYDGARVVKERGQGVPWHEAGDIVQPHHMKHGPRRWSPDSPCPHCLAGTERVAGEDDEGFAYWHKLSLTKFCICLDQSSP